MTVISFAEVAPEVIVKNKRSSPRVRARSRLGRCYELCGRGQLRARDWILVHGEVDQIPHAWLELDGIVYDAVQDKFWDAGEYYRVMEAHVYGRFTVDQAAKEGSKTGYWQALVQPPRQFCEAGD